MNKDNIKIFPFGGLHTVLSYSATCSIRPEGKRVILPASLLDVKRKKKDNGKRPRKRKIGTKCNALEGAKH